jgi:hypothetical protein
MKHVVLAAVVAGAAALRSGSVLIVPVVAVMPPAFAGEGCIRGRAVCDAAIHSALDCVAKNPLSSLLVCKSQSDVKESVCAQADFTCKREAEEESKKNNDR